MAEIDQPQPDVHRDIIEAIFQARKDEEYDHFIDLCHELVTGEANAVGTICGLHDSFIRKGLSKESFPSLKWKEFFDYADRRKISIDTDQKALVKTHGNLSESINVRRQRTYILDTWSPDVAYWYNLPYIGRQSFMPAFKCSEEYTWDEFTEIANVLLVLRHRKTKQSRASYLYQIRCDDKPVDGCNLQVKDWVILHKYKENLRKGEPTEFYGVLVDEGRKRLITEAITAWLASSDGIMSTELGDRPSLAQRTRVTLDRHGLLLAAPHQTTSQPSPQSSLPARLRMDSILSTPQDAPTISNDQDGTDSDVSSSTPNSSPENMSSSATPSLPTSTSCTSPAARESSPLARCGMPTPETDETACDSTMEDVFDANGDPSFAFEETNLSEDMCESSAPRLSNSRSRPMSSKTPKKQRTGLATPGLSSPCPSGRRTSRRLAGRQMHTPSEPDCDTSSNGGHGGHGGHGEDDEDDEDDDDVFGLANDTPADRGWSPESVDSHLGRVAPHIDVQSMVSTSPYPRSPSSAGVCSSSSESGLFLPEERSSQLLQDPFLGTDEDHGGTLDSDLIPFPNQWESSGIDRFVSDFTPRKRARTGLEENIAAVENAHISPFTQMNGIGGIDFLPPALTPALPQMQDVPFTDRGEQFKTQLKMIEESGASQDASNLRKARHRWLPPQVKQAVLSGPYCSAKDADILVCDSYMAVNQGPDFSKPTIVRQSFDDGEFYDPLELQHTLLGGYADASMTIRQLDDDQSVVRTGAELVKSIRLGREELYALALDLKVCEAYPPVWKLRRPCRVLEMSLLRGSEGKDTGNFNSKLSFSHIATAGAFSEPRIDVLGATWIRNLFGPVVLIFVLREDAEDAWPVFNADRTGWDPDHRQMYVILEANDVVCLPPFTIYAMYAMEDSFSIGGWFWKQKNIMDSLRPVCWAAENCPSTLPPEMPMVVDGLRKIVHESPASFAPSGISEAEFLAEFQLVTEKLSLCWQ